MNRLWVGWLRLIAFISLILGLIGSIVIYKYLVNWIGTPMAIGITIGIIIGAITIYLFLNIVGLALNYLADIKHYNSYILEEIKRTNEK